jgi:flagellar basal body L-ring protein FlgH
MALSMDEQRMLAEIERRLAAEDPGLAARMSSFRRPGPANMFRSARARVIGSLLTVVVVAVVSLLVYAMVPFRSNSARTLGGHPVASRSLPVMTVSSAGAGGTKTGTAKSGTGQTAKATAGAKAKGSTAAGTTTHRAPASHPASSAARTGSSASPAARAASPTHGP